MSNENKAPNAQDGKENKEFDLGHNNGILPCPFCAAIEGKNVILGYEYPNYRIACIPCGVIMRHDRKDKVIGMWNNQGIRFTHTQMIEFGEMVKQSCCDNSKLEWLNGNLKTNWSSNIFESANDKIRIDKQSILNIPLTPLLGKVKNGKK